MSPEMKFNKDILYVKIRCNWRNFSSWSFGQISIQNTFRLLVWAATLNPIVTQTAPKMRLTYVPIIISLINKHLNDVAVISSIWILKLTTIYMFFPILFLFSIAINLSTIYQKRFWCVFTFFVVDLYMSNLIPLSIKETAHNQQAW